MNQFTKLVAKQEFQMKLTGARGRAVQVKTGDIFVVTNPRHMQDKGIKVARAKLARINEGYMLSLEQVEQLFNVEQ